MVAGWMRGWAAAVRARPGWSLAALVLLAAALACGGTVDHALQRLLHDLEHLPGVAALAALVRPFGRGEVAVLAALVIGLAGRRTLAGRMLLALAIAAALTWALKLGVGRTRPNLSPYSFVSGDTSTAWALVPLLPGGWPAAAGAVVLGLLVAAARVVDGYHWPSDVLAGAAVGLIAALAAARLSLPRWAWLARRSTWTWLGLAGLVGGIAWAAAGSASLLLFACVWLPPLLAWALWSRLRPLFRRPLPAVARGPWLVAGCLALALAGLACATTLMDRDEPRNALAAREMVAHGDWLVPTFNGEWRLAKPILPYWLMGGFLRLGVPPDLACRLPAVLAMAGVALLTALTARRLAAGGGLEPGRVALVTALVLATSPLVIVSGSAATTDAVLLVGIAATMWALTAAMAGPLRWWHLAVAGPAVGWAVLAKGPMGLLVPVATVAVGGLLLLLRRADGPPAVRAPVWALLGGSLVCGAALALAWFLPADAATGGVMHQEMIGNQVVKRVMEARESHGGGFWVSLPYYLPVLVVACIAWLPALAVAVRSAWSGAGLSPAVRAILLAWALPVLVAVTLTQTKLPHYLLPMLPPVAMLIAAAVLADAAPGWWRWGARVQLGLLAVLAAGLLLAPLGGLAQDAGLAPAPVVLAPLAIPGVAAGVAVLLLAALVWREARSGRRQAFAMAATVGIVALVAALALNAWRLEALKPAPVAAAAVRAHAGPGTVVAVCGYDEPSLLYYIGPELGPVAIMSNGGDLRRWARSPAPGVCVAERRRLDEAGGAAALGLATVKRLHGYNYSNGKGVELHVLVRGPR